jgi:ATP-dependent Clp protease adapter protein ClpS
MSNIATVPVSFQFVQVALSKIGYKMSHNLSERKIVVFKRESADASYPELVTIKHPDYKSPSNGDDVYEKDYVVDLLQSIFGKDAADGAILRAIKSET